jgi:hypothetical protein
MPSLAELGIQGGHAPAPADARLLPKTKSYAADYRLSGLYTTVGYEEQLTKKPNSILACTEFTITAVDTDEIHEHLYSHRQKHNLYIEHRDEQIMKNLRDKYYYFRH